MCFSAGRLRDIPWGCLDSEAFISRNTVQSLPCQDYSRKQRRRGDPVSMFTCFLLVNSTLYSQEFLHKCFQDHSAF